MIRAALLILLLASPALAVPTQVCVIYGEQSNALRRTVIPDDDAQIPVACAIGKGEALVLVPREKYPFTVDINDAAKVTDASKAAIEAATGKPLTETRAQVLNEKGEVEAEIMADPLIDKLAGKTLEPLIGDVPAVEAKKP